MKERGEHRISLNCNQFYIHLIQCRVISSFFQERTLKRGDFIMDDKAKKDNEIFNGRL